MRFYQNWSRFGDRIALLGSDGVQITYQELEDYGRAIKEQIVTRELVFVLCTNRPGCAASYLACLNSENVPMLLEKGADQERLRELAERYRPSYFLLPEEMEEEASDLEIIYRKWRYILFRRRKVSENCEQQSGFASKMLYPQLALLLTTSGSTGSPKFVRLSYQNLASNAESIREYLEIEGDERPITTLPMHYTYGLSVINSHILAGATILMTEHTIFQKEFWEFLEQEQATSISGVPYTYEMFKKLHIFEMDLPSVKTMTQAGGKLPEALQQAYLDYAEQKGKQFVIMYGQTEATARMAYLPAKKSREKIGSIGIAIPGGRFQLLDANGNKITEAGSVGELVYYGPNVALGYAACRQELAKGDEWCGQLLTGDMAKKDPEGYYYIVGRKKRFLKLYGKRVNMDEVEQMVRKRFGVETAVSGSDDNMCIYVVDPGRKEDADCIQEYLSDKTQIAQKAFTVIPIKEIPRNASGKTEYHKLSENNSSTFCSKA